MLKSGTADLSVMDKALRKKVSVEEWEKEKAAFHS